MGISAARRKGDPCTDGHDYGRNYKLVDPYSCKKYWMCSGGPRGQHYRCNNGKSFNPENQADPCSGPPPTEVEGCWKTKG